MTRWLHSAASVARVIVPTPQFRIEPGGYSVEDVDALLNQFFAVLKSDPAALTGAGLRGVRFRMTPSRPGYAPPQVDAWMKAVAGQLDELPYGAASPPPASPQPIDGWPESPAPPAPPAPYEEPERSFSAVAENYPLSSLSGPIDPSTDPGRNAVRELPATPPWASLTVLIVLLAMITYFVVDYLR